MAELTGWGARHDRGLRLAEAALREVDPEVLKRLAHDVAAATAEATVLVLDEVPIDLDDLAERRVAREAATMLVAFATRAIVDAIAREAARVPPLPFAPPPAGAWVRCRWLRNPRTVPARAPAPTRPAPARRRGPGPAPPHPAAAQPPDRARVGRDVACLLGRPPAGR